MTTTNGHNMTQDQEHFIKTIDGQYMAIKRSGDELKLCARSQQDVKKAPSAKIYYGGTNPRQMAFIFHYNKAEYFPEVDGNKIKVRKFDKNSQLTEPKSSRINATNSPWFERVDVGSGDHFKLRSMVRSSPCLKIVGKAFDCTDDDNADFARITFVEKQTSIIIHQEPHTTS